MDRASERERDSRRTREERDRRRERDGKKLRRHEDGEERRLDHHRHRYGDSSPPESHRRRHDRSPDRHRDSVERRHRSRGDSPSDFESRDRNSVEHDRDKDRRLQRASREDLDDGGPRKRDSSDRVRKSVERERFSREDSSERRHSSKKRKDHRSGDDDELESNHSKRARITDVVEERKFKGRVEDRVVEDDSVLSEVNKEERRGRILKDRRKEEMIVMEEDKRHRLKKEEDINVNGNNERKRNGRRSGYDAELGDKLDAEDGKVTVRKERRFEDANEEKMLDGSVVAKPIFSSKHSEGESKMKQLDSGDRGDVLPLTGGSSANAFSGESPAVGSKVSKTYANSNSLHTKVSSITATNENEGVSIIRSDEVTGKSSTDGTSSSVAGKSGSLSRDALAKAKKALQMQKELSEKLKKISVLNKQSSASFKDNLHRESSDYTGATSRHGGSISLSSSISTPMQTMPNAAKLDVPTVPSENASAASGNSILPGLANAASYEAVKRAQELAARMGFRQDPDFAPLINMFPGTSASDTGAQQLKSTKVPVLLLDAQGREIDQHGNVISQPKVTNLSTLKVNINKQKKEAFHILRPELDADAELNQHFDPRMGVNKMKLMRPKRAAFQFVEEGRWSKQAEVMKIKNQFGEAQAKELKVKQSQLAKAKSEPDDNPNLIAVGERTFKEKKKDEVPEIEWWDKSFLPSGSYNDFAEENLNLEKITVYVEHPRPIEPPVEPAPPPPQPLKLTKKEQKKLRTQRRLAKERDRQEMISQGLLEPPKPKVKMSNLMKVLSSEATQDPTKVEKEVRAAALEREQAHIDRNIARKLTPQERREKKERKLFEDSFTLETLVSVYRINDLSHPQTRFKVDVNAQENRLTGCAVISDGISVVVVEGGRKSIKRYGKLMLKRINWTAAVGGNEDGDESTEAPLNRCVLVWQGSIAKPSFNRFHVHQCRSEAASRKILADAGVPHYWDMAVNFLDELS